MDFKTFQEYVNMIAFLHLFFLYQELTILTMVTNKLVYHCEQTETWFCGHSHTADCKIRQCAVQFIIITYPPVVPFLFK